MKFGIINNYILFGGGYTLLINAQKLKEAKKELIVVTSPRQINETFRINQKDFIFEDYLNLCEIPYLVINNLKDFNFYNYVNKYSLGISFGAAWIFKDKFINDFEDRLINLHPSNLPLNRGGGGFSWIIMQGQTYNSNTIHMLTRGIDDGDIVLQQDFYYPENCKIPLDYQDYSNIKACELLDVFFKNVEENYEFKIKTQNIEDSSYWPRLNTKINGFINWNWSVEEIYRFICAFDKPYVGASTYIENNLVRLQGCQIDNRKIHFHPFQVGIIFKKYNNEIFIATKNGTLKCKYVYDGDENNLINEIKLGDRLVTSQEDIDKSMNARIFYNSKGLV